MDEVLTIIDRIQSDSYGDKYEKQMEEKYGKLRWYTEEFTEKGCRSKRVLILRDAEVRNPKIQEKVRKDLLNNAKAESNDRKRDLRTVMRLIANNVDKWWD